MKSKGGLLKMVLLILLLLLVVGFFVVRSMVGSYLSPDYIVGQLEENLNCRAEVKSIDSQLFSRPAKVILKGVSLAPVDEEISKPLDERTAIVQSVLQADEIVLEASLSDLIKKQLTVENLSLGRLRADITVPEEGPSNLSEIFQSKDTGGNEVAIHPEPQPIAEAPVAEAGGGDEALDPLATTDEQVAPPLSDVNPDAEEEKTHISELPLAGQLRRLAIENGTIYIHLKKSKTTLTFDHTQFTLSDLDVNPDSIGSNNSGNLNLSTHLQITKTKADSLLADLKLKGEGTITPFDPTTGNLDPAILAKIHVLEGSNLDGLPMLSKLTDKLSFLEKIGIDMSDLDLKTDIAKDSLLDLDYSGGSIKTVAPAELEFFDYRLGLSQGSSINPSESLHDMECRLLFGEKLSDKLLSTARENIASSDIPIISPEKFDSVVEARLLENGRLKFPFHSRGDLGKPEVETPLTELIADILPNAVDNILKKLLENSGGSGSDDKDGKKKDKNPLQDLLKGLLN